MEATKEKKKSKWKITAGIILVVQLVLSLTTVGIVLWLNMLPELYVMLFGLILLFFADYGILSILFREKRQKKDSMLCPTHIRNPFCHLHAWLYVSVVLICL